MISRITFLDPHAPWGCDMKYYTGNDYNYQMAVEWPENIKSVWFNVNATNDIHISLSKTEPLTSSSWEIVLGAMSGGMSLIRPSHQGVNLASVSHTYEQFNEVQHSPTYQRV